MIEQKNRADFSHSSSAGGGRWSREHHHSVDLNIEQALVRIEPDRTNLIERCCNLIQILIKTPHDGRRSRPYTPDRPGVIVTQPRTNSFRPPPLRRQRPSTCVLEVAEHELGAIADPGRPNTALDELRNKINQAPETPRRPLVLTAARFTAVGQTRSGGVTAMSITLVGRNWARGQAKN